MIKVFLDDRDVSADLHPFTLIRSVLDIRIGILTLREKWKHHLGKETVVESETSQIPADAHSLPANILPSPELVKSLSVAATLPANLSTAKTIRYPWDIFMLNDSAIREDFELVARGRPSEPIPESVFVTNARDVFIEKGAKLDHCYISAVDGPVYIARDAEVMAGALLRGPLAICEGAVIKMGAKIYGATTIGPYSIVGGEIKNSVIFGYSNKAHDGYLGDSVVGEWCNIGAGTSNSNMKNNVSEVRMWNEATKQMINTGFKKCGLIMGDYSRAAINTSFNTGTMVGVCANIFGPGEVPKVVPNFSWGSTGSHKYQFEKAVSDIEKWMKLKGHALDEKQKIRLKLIFDQ